MCVCVGVLGYYVYNMYGITFPALVPIVSIHSSRVVFFQELSEAPLLYFSVSVGQSLHRFSHQSIKMTKKFHTKLAIVISSYDLQKL